MNRTGQIVFIVFIAAYMIFWGAIILIAIPKEQRNSQKKKYDERQRIEQGRACQYAYITLIGYLVAYMVLDQVFGIVWCDTVFGLLLGIAFSASVFLAYCVFQDAYFSVNEGKPASMIGINAVGLSQLLLGIEHIVDGDVIENGIITANAVNLLFAALILLFDVFFLIRKRLDKPAD